MTTRLSLFFTCFLIACEEGTVIDTISCNPILQEEPTLSNDSSQTLLVSPLSEIWDTRVLIDGSDIEITALNRSACSSCDVCRIEQGCDSCEECTECEAVCDPNVCIESLGVQIPLLTTNTVQLQVINQYGYSPLYNLDVDSVE